MPSTALQSIESRELAVDERDGVLGLDPRTHLAVLVAVSIAALAIVSFLPLVTLEALAMLYLALNGHARLAFQCGLSFAIAWGLSLIPLPGLYGALFVSLLHMMPPFTSACSLLTASPSSLMCAFSRWHLPSNVLIGICMAFRFATLLPSEARSVLQGIHMRGIFPRTMDLFLHPALAYECFYTPLVMRVLRLSNQLAASSELRGIDAESQRTSLHHVGVGARDTAAFAVFALLSAAAVALDVIV